MKIWILAILIHNGFLGERVNLVGAAYADQATCEKQRDTFNDYYKTKNYLCINGQNHIWENKS